VAARITMNTTLDGELEIWLNKEGRDLLIRELKRLGETNDHFHLGAQKGAEVAMSARPYRPTDTIVHAGKVLLRPGVGQHLLPSCSARRILPNLGQRE
jgi:hypothetical protein